MLHVTSNLVCSGAFYTGQSMNTGTVHRMYLQLENIKDIGHCIMVVVSYVSLHGLLSLYIFKIKYIVLLGCMLMVTRMLYHIEVHVGN